MKFYTYLWLRQDGTPYYVGKGTRGRFYDERHSVKRPTRDRVVLYPAESEVDAFETEIALIWYYGRKDLGTGILRNLTNGGDGSSGHIPSPETIEKRASKIRGIPRKEETKVKLREVHKGNRYAAGYSPTPEQRIHMGAAQRCNKNALGHVVSVEARRRMSDACWQRHHIYIL